MVFALASRTLRTSSYRPLLSNIAGARRGYAEAVSDKLKLSFVVPYQVGEISNALTLGVLRQR